MASSVLMAGSKLPPPSSGKLLTVLGIDGGGMRGLIPAVVLQYLEQELKKLGGEGVRIADYFDVIAGTSTGGLIATMLTAPNDDEVNPRPKYTADDVRDFYFNDGPLIFPASDKPPNPIFGKGPKHDGVHLRKRLEEELGSTRLNQTLTNVVIPTFDIGRLAPVIFSSYKVKQPDYKYLDALLSDVSLATSAAPMLLPAHHFTVQNSNGDTDFNMVDGAFTAANPTLAALSEIAQEKEKSPKLYPMMMQPFDYSNVLVVSLGCGFQPSSNKQGFTADEVNEWSRIKWAEPALQFLANGSLNTTDYFMYSLFKSQHVERNYLRVEIDNLTPGTAGVDDATPENLAILESLGKELLNEQVKRINPVTFVLEPIGEGTNAEALTRIAEILYKEKTARLANN